MAAEDKGAEDNKPEERQARARRQRPPVTIDLTAERVPETSGRVGDHPAAEPAAAAPDENQTTAAPEAAPAGETASAAPPQDAAPAEPAGAPARPPGGGNGGWAYSLIAGVIGGVAAIALFGWRFYVDHVWSWDLFAIALTIVGVKMALMAWYFLTE